MSAKLTSVALASQDSRRESRDIKVLPRIMTPRNASIKANIHGPNCACNSFESNSHSALWCRFSFATDASSRRCRIRLLSEFILLHEFWLTNFFPFINYRNNFVWGRLSYNYLLRCSILLSQRESFVTVKFFDAEISMIFDISELPVSKYAFSR